ncbi:MAG TPA: ParA family protein [Deinococcales bacterium]|nr:ParA family protein [Deinococcales bacterium]
MALARMVVVAQGKGGVGKTSLTANVAGLSALAGHRVLAVDLDQQGNLARDLGYEPGDGEQLLQAFVGGQPAPVLRGVRPGLDVVPGGPAIADLVGIAFARSGRGGKDLADLLHQSLAPLSEDYDLVLVDTPPGERLLVEAALAIASYVVVPTRADDGSLDGLERVAERCLAARERNPDLKLLGVCLFGVGSRSRRVGDGVRKVIAEVLGDVAPVFEAQVRHSESAAVDARRQGLLIHELESAAVAARRGRLAALRARRRPEETLLTRDASGLAGDYAELAREIVSRVGQMETVVSA